MTVVGCLAAILFQFSLSLKGKKIPQLSENAPLLPQIFVEPAKVNFFKRLDFYQNGTLYVVGRVCATSVMVFLPLWLSKIRGGKKENIATVPLVSFIASFVASVGFKQTYRLIGARCGYVLGGLVALAGCAWVFVDINHDEWELYSLSILLGMGHSLFIIASLNMTADMIGNNLAQSGSVYSLIALFDKLITGVAIFIIESLYVLLVICFFKLINLNFSLQPCRARSNFLSKRPRHRLRRSSNHRHSGPVDVVLHQTSACGTANTTKRLISCSFIDCKLDASD